MTAAPEKQKTYKKVFDIARAALEEGDLDDRFARAGVPFTQEGKTYHGHVPFFDDTITLTIPGFEFRSSRGSNITLVSRIIMLHYLLTASGLRQSGDLIPYEDIPGCRSYLPVFEGRVIKPLLSAFGFNRDAFVAAGAALAAEGNEYGDASFTLRALPRVPLFFILWEGDQEFQPSVKVLFDRTISGYLPLEDITVISKLASTRIIKAARMAYSE